MTKTEKKCSLAAEQNYPSSTYLVSEDTLIQVDQTFVGVLTVLVIHARYSEKYNNFGIKSVPPCTN